MSGQQGPRPRVEHGAAADREHAVGGREGLGDRLRLQRPEVLLAGVDEDVGDSAATMSSSVSRTGSPQRRSSSPATVDFPDPMGPMSTVVIGVPAGSSSASGAISWGGSSVAHLNLRVSR